MESLISVLLLYGMTIIDMGLSLRKRLSWLKRRILHLYLELKLRLLEH